MHKNKKTIWQWAPRAIVITGAAMTGLTTLLRVVLLPLLRDSDTGRFQTNYVTIAAVILAVVAMAVMASHTFRPRVDIAPTHSLFTAIAALVAGIGIGLWSVYFAVLWWKSRIVPPPAQLHINTLSLVVMYAMFIFGILGAIGLIIWGLQVAAESGTRRGMSAWWLLAPVMWAWFRLVWFEMAYAASVGWSEKFFDFLMVIAQMLFLFKLARFVSGIGKTPPGEMLVYAMSAALFSLSGTATRVILYFVGGAEAYTASKLAGIADFAVGVFAMAFAFVLVPACEQQERLDAAAKAEEAAEEDDTPYDPSLEPLLVLDDGDGERNQL